MPQCLTIPLSTTSCTDVSIFQARYPRKLNTANPAKIPVKKFNSVTPIVSLPETQQCCKRQNRKVSKFRPVYGFYIRGEIFHLSPYKIWNALPDYVVSASSVDLFRINLKLYFPAIVLLLEL